MFKNAEVVLFDLDGTLIDSAPDLGAAVDKMRTDRGMPSLSLDHYRPMAGAGARGMLGLAFGMKPDHADFPAMREEFFRNYESDLTARTTVFDGVADLLQQLTARGIRWGVVTNKAERFSIPLTKAMPLFNSAGALVCGDTTPHAKPHPEPLFEAMRRMGVEPAHCIYVGDDERDIVAGRAANVGTVAAAYGYLGSGEGPAGWGADLTISSPSELLKVLRP
jgi:phosphoglycolate phosphatase